MNDNEAVLKGTVTLDLTFLGVGVVSCDAKLRVSESELIRSVVIPLPKLGTEALNKVIKLDCPELENTQITGELESGEPFTATVGYLEGVNFINVMKFMVEIKLVLLDLQRDRRSTTQIPSSLCFYLNNFLPKMFDQWTEKPLPSDAPLGAKPGGALDRIEFQAFGTNWTIQSLLDPGVSKIKLKSSPFPLRTATLTVSLDATADFDKRTSQANDICIILSFALSRHVHWHTVSNLSDDGEEISSSQRAVYSAPVNRGGHAPVDNFSKGTLKGFVELALQKFETEREWYSKTLQLFSQEQQTDVIDINCAILNILLDRIAVKVVGESVETQIDPKLSEKMDEDFFEKLHALFFELTAEWKEERTHALISTVNQWNAKPSFVKSIKSTCNILRLPEPCSKLIKARHKLLHAGDLDPGNLTVVKYWQDLEWLVLQMILRMFSYEGQVYHSVLGAQSINLSDHLV